MLIAFNVGPLVKTLTECRLPPIDTDIEPSMPP
jgi:hypothetical protein